MSKDNKDTDNVINIGYFNVDNKKNSILENTDFKDDEINKHLDNIESLTNEIKNEILKSENDNNKMIDFKKIKQDN